MSISKRFKCILIPLIAVIAVLAIEESSPCFVHAADTHYIAVGSDRHNTPEAIKISMAGMPASVEYVCLNGDMTDFASTSGDSGGGAPSFGVGDRPQMAYDTATVLGEVKEVFPKLSASNVSIVYGSHDANATDSAGIMKCADASLIPSQNQSDYADISRGRSGRIFTGYDGGKPAYYVYGVSYYDMINPGDDTVGGGIKSAEEFKQFADEHSGVPLVVIGHVPIHALRGDNLAASYWNKALDYAATGSENGSTVKRDVVYLHGHNHTSESTEYFLSPGDTMSVQGISKSESENSVIRYTYITAGYLRDNHTSTLIGVKNGKLSFKKYKGCVVTFDTVGGSSIAEQYVTTGGLVTEPEAPDRSGYVFKGWYKEASCENLWDFATDKITEDATLYASWIKGSKPAKPVLKTVVKALKKRVVVSLGKVKGANDYRVVYRKAGASNWTRKWSNGKPTYTITGLKNKELYEIKAMAASESGDSYIYSDSSNTSYRYLSSLKGIKVTGNKKSKRISVKWKKDSKATGYLISYSTKKSMKNAKKIKVAKSKKSYVIKKLKKGKTYYVRIRPLVKKGNITYHGAYCKIRKVKI